MRFALALLLLAGCGGSAPTTYPADSGAPDAYVAPDAGQDAGEVFACPCSAADGPCCDGCWIKPAGTPCGLLEPTGTTTCILIGSNSTTHLFPIVRRCDGVAAACVNQDTTATKVVIDCIDRMCPGVNCSHGCTNVDPDCGTYADGCWAPADVRDMVCRSLPWLGN